jgi:hypothetical protein
MGRGGNTGIGLTIVFKRLSLVDDGGNFSVKLVMRF